MDPFKIIVMALILVGIILQVYQFHDFTENRSLAIEVIYIAVILALILTTDFLPWLNF